MSSPIKVVVLGAGIGGLTTAAALRHAGFGVELYEAGPELRAQGFGLSVQANGINALRSLDLGLDTELLERGGRVETFQFRKPEGTLIRELPVYKLDARLGAPAVALHRADLHAALVRAIGDTPTFTGAQATRFIDDGDRVRVEFADGREAEGDLLIGADGIHSMVRAQLHGRSEPRPGNFVCWLACIPFEHPRVPRGASAHYWGTGMRFGIHDIGHGRVYWWGTMTMPGEEAADWQGTKDDLLRLYAGWAPEVRACIEQTEWSDVLAVPAQDRPPLAELGRGRVTLLGDAAHPMLPSLGQGANSAIEDAVVLAHTLANSLDPVAGLRRYEQLRADRTAMFVNGSAQLAKVEQTDNDKAVAVRDAYFRRAPEAFFLNNLAKPMGFPELGGPSVDLPRALSPMERWHWIADQLAPLHILSRVRVHGTVTAEQIRKGLDEVQRRHPLLRVAIAANPDGTEPEFVPTDRPLPLRVVESADPDAWLSETDEVELREPFDWQQGPLGRAVLITDPAGQSADLVVTLHYSIADGESAMTVAKQILQVAAGEAGELPVSPVRPGPESLFPAKYRGGSGTRKMIGAQLRDQLAMLRKPRRLEPITLVPSAQRRSRVVHRKLDGDRLDALLAGCESRGVSLQSVLSAALLVGAAREAGTTGAAPYTVGSSVNFRSHLDGVVSDAEVGSYQGMIATMANYAPWASLWQLAGEIDGAYRERMARRDHMSALNLLQAVGPKSVAASASTVKLMDSRGPGHLCMTYLGQYDVPDKIGAWRLSEAQFVSGMSVSGFIMATANATHGQLSFNVGYVEPAVSAERAELLADESIRALLSAI
ncbi:FAD-dependent monooxygenase [Nocardia cyriacigeorgica]|uniref:Phthiocerol/phthiodiolone dimycocerosyl transferase n=1 Tax=Nocardia cyriacigeorgica TaxID=135487 RepID=A0A5R8NX55_9NOCA|nr:FAD-dependent monooxygenase [Nocardia cyriacigeorgica]TLF80884.1 FAD-dependent monooxygenase [Nocardia cyriacigeorgica]